MFCPLDCWDSCKINLKENKFIIDKEFFKIFSQTSKPFLCYKLNHYFQFQQTYKNDLKKVVKLLKEAKNILYIKGSGNMGVFQNVTKLFFEKIGATFAIGSTCDGIGEKGIKKAINKSLSLPLKVIKNSKNIILWGRNAYVTNTHLIPIIDKKYKITIDAIYTKSARNSDKFIQVKVNRDYFLALLLSRIVIENDKFNKNGKNFEEFKKIVFSYSINELINFSGVNLKEANFLLNKLKEGSAVLLGLGVAKCKECYKTTWAIFSLMKLLDYFNKKDRGVAFLGSSLYKINNPFDIEHKKRVALFDINLDNYDLVFIQGANPLKSFVGDWSKLKEKKVIVFGKYFDETAKIADVFIQTKEFYNKIDVRGSYFHEYVITNEISKSESGISEYEFTKFLFKEFNFEGLKSEKEYLDIILSSLKKIDTNLYINTHQNGYKDEEFNFLNEKFNIKNKPFEIVTAKYEKGLNSQFLQDEKVYINRDDKEVLNYLNQKFDSELIVKNDIIPKNVIYTRNRKINQFLKAEGFNAYYEI